MDIVLYSRPQSSYTAEDVAALFDALDRSGMGWRVNRDFASLAESLAGRSFAPDELYDDASQIGDRAQVMVSYGGDGTFLDCVRMLAAVPCRSSGSTRTVELWPTCRKGTWRPRSGT
ncbi:MAG: hypothetical protein ACLR76_05355 [Alistipes sp.]